MASHSRAHRPRRATFIVHQGGSGFVVPMSHNVSFQVSSVRFELPLSFDLTLRQPLRGLARFKLRSALSSLGITIGIASVVWVVALGRAGSDRVRGELAKLGNNLVWVEAGSRNVAGVRTGNQGTTTLTLDDAAAILREVPLIKSVSPQVDGSVRIAYGNRNWTTRSRGVGPEYLLAKRWTVAEGNAFTQEQVEADASVCLIGETVRQQLFGDASPVGATVRVQRFPCDIVGVLAMKGQSATGFDQDDVVLLPYTTALTKIRGRGFLWLNDIVCSAVSAEAVEPATDQVVRLLRQRHQIVAGAVDDFNIRKPDELLEAEAQSMQTLQSLLLAVAAVSLLVGGIGVMNVMLASVLHRTHEIGLRLAVGAPPGAIRAQFTMEALLLCLSGGALGALAGAAGIIIAQWVTSWPLELPLSSLGVALGFCVATGMLSGAYPAHRAANVDPITALRQ